jgi:hypothetical protein
MDFDPPETGAPQPRPFETTIYPQRSLIDRVLGRERPGAAGAALRSMLAAHRIDEIHRADVGRVFEAERVSGAERRRICDGLWRTAFTAFISDNEISQGESAYLHALRSLLEVPEEVVLQAEQDLAYPRFRLLVERVLADEVATPVEREEIDRLGSALGLSKAVVLELYRTPAESILHRRLHEMLADRRVSPHELHQFKSFALGLCGEVGFAPATEQLVAKFARLWRLERGIDLPTVNPGARLGAAETCHIVTGATWSEIRSDRRGGEVLTELDSGVLYVTSARLVFDGELRNRLLRYSAILGVVQYSDAVAIEKPSGRSPVLKPLNEDAEILGATIRGAMNVDAN